MIPRIGSFWVRKGDRPLLAKDGNVYIIVELSERDGFENGPATVYGPVIRYSNSGGTVSFVNKRKRIDCDELERDWELWEP